MAERDEVLSHNYDGIQEYDNDLPGWWVAIFWVTSIFAVVYVWYLHLGPGLDQHEAVAKDMKEYYAFREELEKKKEATQGVVGEPQLLALAKDDSALTKGKEIFVGKCAACHGQLGEGIVGPNLTDDYFIHGASVMDVKRIVVNGVLEKGMLPWKDQLSDDEINQVAAYVYTLRGTNPPNGKKPEGELVAAPS